MKSIFPDYAWVKTQQGRRAKILTWPDKTRQEKNITRAQQILGIYRQGSFWAFTGGLHVGESYSVTYGSNSFNTRTTHPKSF